MWADAERSNGEENQDWKDLEGERDWQGEIKGIETQREGRIRERPHWGLWTHLSQRVEWRDEQAVLDFCP
jgi:hypothetical protein